MKNTNEKIIGRKTFFANGELLTNKYIPKIEIKEIIAMPAIEKTQL